MTKINSFQYMSNTNTYEMLQTILNMFKMYEILFKPTLLIDGLNFDGKLLMVKFNLIIFLRELYVL